MSAGDRDTLTDAERKRIELAVHNDKDRGHGFPVKAETLDEVIASIVRAAQAQALREAADLIAVTKFNDPFGVNREAWKLLRDRADRLDAGDEFQNPED